MITTQKKFMQLAIKGAVKARQQGNYAVGSVLIKGNKVLAVCSNRSNLQKIINSAKLPYELSPE